MSSVRLGELGVQDLDEIEAFWRAASPLHPVTRAMLRGRLFESPGAEPDLTLGARGEGGRLLGLASGVCIPEHARFAGVRWLALDSALDIGRNGKAVAGPLLEELGRRLAARGVTQARMMGTPPYYFRPGVDTRETGLIACLLDLGWVQEGTAFNMTVELGELRIADCGLRIEESDVAERNEKYRVRRAREEDREAFRRYMEASWTATWRDESLQAFGNDPITLHLAVRDEDGGKGEAIVGFAAYEVSQCLGGFGPTGVTGEHRGAALGKKLLWACLEDLWRAGRERCEIGWVGPVGFYHRACGAALGPAYWMMKKELGVRS